MTPEEKIQFAELKAKVEALENEKIQSSELKAKVEALENVATIPYSVDSAFRARFNIDALTPIEGSTKVSTSENVTINEAGVATKTAMNPPDAFKQVVISGTVYYIPVYTS